MVLHLGWAGGGVLPYSAGSCVCLSHFATPGMEETLLKKKDECLLLQHIY